MPGFCPWIPSCCSDKYAIAKLLSQPLDDRIIQPVIYLAASQEVFSLVLIVTWILTIMFFPHQIKDHPAQPIIGSYNPCFGWDYAPASYIALTGCSVNVYLTWRWSWLDQTRVRLINPGKKTCVNRFEVFTCYLLQCASNLWLLLWLIGPNDDHPRDDSAPNIRNWMIHTGIFVAYGLAAYLATVGNYLAVKYGPYGANVHTKHTAYLIVYGVAYGYLVVVYFYDLYNYEYGEDPALPGFVTQFADIVWMITFGNSFQFMPVEPPLEIQTSVSTEWQQSERGIGAGDVVEEGETDHLVANEERCRAAATTTSDATTNSK